MKIINNTRNNLDLITQFATVPDDECGGKWWLESKTYPKGECMWPPQDHYDIPSPLQVRIQIQGLNGPKGPSFPSDGDLVCDGTTVGLRNFKLQILDHGAD